jgi:hypothetical protein
METKFNIKQTVYFIADGVILQGDIRGIKSIFISDYSEKLTTTYYIKYTNSCDPIWVNEFSIFKDKTDLTNHIYKL